MELRRFDDERARTALLTDDQGQAHLEVLPGVFQMRVSREDYRPLLTDRLVTVSAVQNLSDLRLVRLKDGVKQP